MHRAIRSLGLRKASRATLPSAVITCCDRASLQSRCPPGRRHLATLLKEHALVEGGDLQVATWIKDEGFDTTIPSVMQVRKWLQCPAFCLWMRSLCWEA